MRRSAPPYAAASAAPAQPPARPPARPARRDKDPREDIQTLARMYLTALEMQLRDKSRCGGPARRV